MMASTVKNGIDRLRNGNRRRRLAGAVIISDDEYEDENGNERTDTQEK